MPISTWDELPIQDERLSPHNLPNQISPIRGAFTMFGLEVLDNVATFRSLANTTTSFLKNTYDGWFSEHPEVSSPISEQSRSRIKQFYPDVDIPLGASQEQVSALLDRYDREKAMEYLQSHASPGFAGSAGLFVGGVAGSFTDIGALYGAKWISKGISKGSELLAAKTAESAVSRLGGTASVQAQQLIANNAGKLSFLKGGATLAGFTGIELLERQGAAYLTGALTPNEADYHLMDGVFDIASSGLVGGLLGLGAEKLTGKMIDKSFVIETPEQKAARRENERSVNRQRNEDLLNNIHMMSFEAGSKSESLRKAAQVIKNFFKTSKEETERETLDNVSQSLEAGKEPHNDYLFEVNRHEAWKNLQRHLSETGLTPDEFIETLTEQREALIQALDNDNPNIDDLQQFMTNEALIDLATRTEDEVIPSDATKAAYLKSMRDNYVHLDENEAPYLDTENIEEQPEDILQQRIDAFADEELQELSNNGNRFATAALNRKAFLQHEDTLRQIFGESGAAIIDRVLQGEVFNAENLREFLENISLDDVESAAAILEDNATDFEFLAERINSIIERLRNASKESDFLLSEEEFNKAITEEFKLIKAQVIRSQRDAIAFENKKRILNNAVHTLDTADGNALRQAVNALLDRSLLKFEGANEGTYRKMNDAEAVFKAEFTRLLNDDKTMEFWNDTNSSTEISRALFAEDMGLPMDEYSVAAQKIAKMVNKFYDLAVDLYAKEGILIPRLKGRIHHQWHNPYKIMKMPWRQRLRMSITERREFQFKRWYEFIRPKIDLENTFRRDVIAEEGEPAFIDINNEQEVQGFFRRTFEKIIERDYRREKTNLLTKRSRERVLQFKTPEDFAAYTQRFGAGDAQSAILRELSGMFREVELVKDWGAEPEVMLEDVLQHASTLPGWKDYSLRKDAETPRRLMHLMRFGAAHSTGEWGMMFSELVYNLRAYESVTKLGNLFFLNAGDSLVAANALNRFSIPMQESIAKSVKETFSKYTPQEQQDLLRMFGIAKSQYFGGFYRHFEDGTLSTRLNKMLRITMKLTGTENSEYSNRSMIGQVLSNWFATHVKTMEFDQLDPTSSGTLSRYGIGAEEWNIFRDAIRTHKGNEYIGWDTIEEISDSKIRDYLHQKGVKYVTKERVEITRDELGQKYRLMMLDQMDDALNRKSLTETDLLRFKRDPTEGSPINDAINMMMLFKTYGFMWIRRHVGDRIYGRGAKGFRVSQIQGTADWHGLMKLMCMSFAMELAINQMKELANKHQLLPLNGKTAMDSLLGSLGPISYLTRIDGQNLLSSITRMIAGPIGADAEKIARIATQFERGFWKGDYTNAQVNSIKFLADQFGGVPMLKSAFMTLWADNMIQNIKGRRVGHIIDNVAANQPE